ncbi:uncharacterized protein [Dysidea avara]
MPYDQRPDMRDLGQILTEYCTQWKDIGTQLGLLPAVLKVIDADNTKKRECFREALQKWLQMDTKATWHKLELSITNANREYLGLPKLSSMLDVPPSQPPQQIEVPKDHLETNLKRDNSASEPAATAGEKKRTQSKKGGAKRTKRSDSIELDDTTDEPVATNSGRKRKQSKKGGAKRMKKSESTESGKQLQDTIVNSEPEVIDLRQIVVPRVYAHWRDVAFALYYKITTVNGIEAKHKKDPEESCKGLFEDWLSTNNGERAGPKTWATLLGAIEKVKKLAKARKEILKEVAQL